MKALSLFSILDTAEARITGIICKKPSHVFRILSMLPTRASKHDLCGAHTSIGASLLLACLPIILNLNIKIEYILHSSLSYLIPKHISKMVPKNLLTPLVTSFLQPCSGILCRSSLDNPTIARLAMAQDITIVSKDRGSLIGTRNNKPKINFNISTELIFS